MFGNLREDTRRLRAIKTKGFPWYVIESLLFENGYQAVVLYRTAHWFKRRRIPFFGPLFGRLSVWLTGVDISPGADIGPGLMISHGQGIVVGRWARIGANATLLHGATLGGPALDRREEMPRLGDDILVGAGARLIGGIDVGDGAIIGANAVVTEDIPPGSRVFAGGGITIKPPPDQGS